MTGATPPRERQSTARWVRSSPTWQCAFDVSNGTAPGRISVQTVTRKHGHLARDHGLTRCAHWPTGRSVCRRRRSTTHRSSRRRNTSSLPWSSAPGAGRLAPRRYAIDRRRRSPRARSSAARASAATSIGFLKLEAIGEDKTSFVGVQGTKDQIATGVQGLIARHHNQNAGDDELRDGSGTHRHRRHPRADELPRGTGQGRRPQAAQQGAARAIDNASAPTTDSTGIEVPSMRHECPDIQAEDACICTPA